MWRRTGELLVGLLRRLGWSVPRVSAPPEGKARAADGQEPEAPLEPLRHVVLTDGVSRTLFEEYERHRAGSRREEETGWVLLGHRRGCEAVALASLPAGEMRDAGVAHVRFHREVQACATRILWQEDDKLTIVGVVHTHPGSLRHPSHGDYQGDVQWVELLPGQEGVFGIGTFWGKAADSPAALQPSDNALAYRGLRFDWYALAAGDANYRPLPVRMTIGPDLAAALRPVWHHLEGNAERLERLFGQLKRIRCELHESKPGSQLHLVVPVERGLRLRVVLEDPQPIYLLEKGGELLAWDQEEPRIDRGVFLLLAELGR